MTEKELKDQVVRYLRATIPMAVVLRLEDKNTAGIPDIIITYHGHTVWVEVKYANPYVRGRGLQKLTCRRLATQGICWYLIYEERNGYRRTMFVEPKHVVEGSVNEAPDECVSPGFNHEFAVKFIRRQCGDHNEQEHIYRDTHYPKSEEGHTGRDE